MYQSSVISRGRCEPLDYHDEPEQLITWIRESWLEEVEIPAIFQILDSKDKPVAVMMAGEVPEICLTLWQNGVVEKHRVVYHDEGEKIRVEVTRI